MAEGAAGTGAVGGTRVSMTVAPRKQCPACVAFVANLLGAILSYTCIPASTKGASAQAQAATPGKSHWESPALLLHPVPGASC